MSPFEPSESTFRLVVEAAPVAMVVVDRDGKIVLSNRRALELFGFCAEDLIDRPFERLVAPRSKDRVARDLGYFASGEAQEVIGVRKDGTEIALEIDSTSLDGKGGPTTLVVLLDVSTRRRAETSIRHLASIVHSTDDAIVSVSPDGAVATWNKSAESLFGCGYEKALGRPLTAFFQAREREIVGSALVRTGAGGHVLPFTITRSNDDGTFVEHSFLFSPIRDDDMSIVGISLIARDITELGKKEAALQAMLAEKTELVRAIHHRVKNNLQVISSLLHLQERAAQNPIVRESLARSLDRVYSILFVHQQLDLNSGPARVDLKDYLRRIVTNLFQTLGVDPQRRSWTLEGADVHLSIDAAVPCGLIANEIVTNSLRHAFPGNRVGAVAISLSVTGDRVELAISDDGVGIPEGLDPETAETFGLDLVFTFARQLKAQVEFDRAGGTLFRIRFPMR